MPLKLRLGANEKIIVNGVVIQNDNRRTKLTIANKANVLRGKDVMVEDDVDSPAKKLYFLIQQRLIGGEDEELKDQTHQLAADIYVVFASTEILNNIMLSMNEYAAGDYYKSLAALRPVLEYESRLMKKHEEVPKEN